MTTKDFIVTIGRRKASVARLYLRSGKGSWQVNGRLPDEYFQGRPSYLKAVQRPMEIAAPDGKFDVKVNVKGGGLTGQAEAIQLALARALEKLDSDLRAPLKEAGLLTQDSRVVERKKYGRPKARKRYQFSKR